MELTDEKLIQERWKSYFEKLLNVENPRDPLEHVEAVEGPEDEISRTEIEKAVKQMRNNKAPGPEWNSDYLQAKKEVLLNVAITEE